MAKPATTTNAAPGGSAATDGFNFKAVLQQLVQRNASDLHLKVGRPPTLRLHGELVPLEMPPLFAGAFAGSSTAAAPSAGVGRAGAGAAATMGAITG